VIVLYHHTQEGAKRKEEPKIEAGGKVGGGGGGGGGGGEGEGGSDSLSARDLRKVSWKGRPDFLWRRWRCKACSSAALNNYN